MKKIICASLVPNYETATLLAARFGGWVEETTKNGKLMYRVMMLK